MIVFHGSTLTIEHPITHTGRERLDFGRGFYVTDIESQAQRWATRVGSLRQEQPIVNVYQLDIDRVIGEFRCLQFRAYDAEWLEFIVANRNGVTVDDYDMVEGGVANDRVIDTVEAYMSGLMPLDVALGRLALHLPNNQLCIRNQVVIDKYLTFFKSYIVE